MIIINCKQNSDQWIQEKLGKPSASNASKIITNSGKKSQQQDGYLYELAAETITREREDGPKDKNMIMGKEREDESRNLYELIKNVRVKQVGVVYKDKHKKFLCSPDGIIKKKYGLELKNVLPKTQVKYLINKKLPSEYFGQIQFSLYVTGFKSWEFFSYCPGLKHFVIRVKRDERFIKALKGKLEIFCKDLEKIIRKIK